MATMNISLTDPLKQFVDEEVSQGGYSSTSDYVRDLIRQRGCHTAAERGISWGRVRSARLGQR